MTVHHTTATQNTSSWRRSSNKLSHWIGLSASLAHLFTREGFKVALAARNTESLRPGAAAHELSHFHATASDSMISSLIS
jgi:NAD(P)-dependent dehydrogenase (short-subunit alcohol dehydrogenase family)